MSDGLDVEDGQLDGGKLRKLYEESLKSKKELETKLAELEAKERGRSVESFLQAKGLNPKLAKFVPADAGDEEKLNAWVEDNKDLFGAPVASEEPGKPSLPEESAKAFSQIQQVSEAGNIQTVDLNSLQAQIGATKNMDELRQLMAQYRVS
jgi:hypothetical protein